MDVNNKKKASLTSFLIDGSRDICVATINFAAVNTSSGLENAKKNCMTGLKLGNVP